MNPQELKKNRLKSLLSTSPVDVAADASPVDTYPPGPGHPYPFVIQARHAFVVLPEWIASHRAFVDQALSRHGGILFRGFPVHTVAAFGQVVECFGENTLPYTQRSSPRTEIVRNIYTSTDHPADQAINMHNELSYAHEWPGKIMFCCLVPAASGGQTPIADSRRVLEALSPATRARFEERGVQYVRNLGGGLGLPWQEVFQTTDQGAVEAECTRNGMAFEWKAGGRLQIGWKRPAVQRHPVTGEAVWFNHALFFNAAGLDAVIADTLGAESLPFNTFYGDGQPIEAEVIQEIGAAFDRARTEFTWQQGDILYLDNQLMAHGRNPYSGKRQVAVAMWEPHR
jgi:alpha-ketoglutarate-dependent taurine dioxygenase